VERRINKLNAGKSVVTKEGKFLRHAFLNRHSRRPVDHCEATLPKNNEKTDHSIPPDFTSNSDRVGVNPARDRNRGVLVRAGVLG
jgi:hypothetical protein